MPGFSTVARGPRSLSLPAARTVLFVIVIFVSGCFSPRFKPPGDSITGAQASALCSQARSRNAPVTSLRALVDATVSRSDESASFRYVIIGSGSDRFRIDMLPVEGAFTLGILVVRDGETLLLDAQEKTYTRTPNESELLEMFLGLGGITRNVIVGLVTGILPPIDCSSVRVYLRGDGALSISEGASTIVWHLRPDTFVIDGLELLDRGGRRVQISAEREAASPEGLPAVHLKIFKPLEARVEMLVKKLSIDPQLSEALFTVAVPKSYTERLMKSY
jgi:hypothetical protein